MRLYASGWEVSRFRSTSLAGSSSAKANCSVFLFRCEPPVDSSKPLEVFSIALSRRGTRVRLRRLKLLHQNHPVLGNNRDRLSGRGDNRWRHYRLCLTDRHRRQMLK